MIVISILPNAYCLFKALITSFIKQLSKSNLLLEVDKVPAVARINGYGSWGICWRSWLRLSLTYPTSKERSQFTKTNILDNKFLIKMLLNNIDYFKPNFKQKQIGWNYLEPETEALNLAQPQLVHLHWTGCQQKSLYLINWQSEMNPEYS